MNVNSILACGLLVLISLYLIFLICLFKMLNCLPPIPSRERKLPDFYLYTPSLIIKKCLRRIYIVILRICNQKNLKSKMRIIGSQRLVMSKRYVVCQIAGNIFFYLHGSNILLQRILEEKLASAQKQFQIFNSNQKNQKVYYTFDFINVQIADVIRHIKDIDEKTADLAIQSCKGNEVKTN